jgi:hypothetical protein
MLKPSSRRRFLQQAAATLAWALGLAGSSGPPLAAGTPFPSHSGPRTTDAVQEHFVFLPYISRPRMPRGPSKLGVHTIRPDGASGFVRQVSEAGAQVALVKALDDIGYLHEVHDVSPGTTRVARRQDPWGGGIGAEGDPVEAAQERMEWHMGTWEPDREWVDYWEVLNEPDPPGVDGHRWLAEFYIACMDIADQNGYKLALFSYSVGVPEWEEWQGIVATGVFERAQAGGHILALHEYNWPYMDERWGEPLPGHTLGLDRGVLTGRYRHLYEGFLIPRDLVIPLAITEAGFDPSVVGQGWDGGWKDRYVSEMAWYDDRLREDDYVIGCALFTLGGIGIWRDWDYEDLLEDLRDYLLSLKDHP